jgi:hypothetical protein
MGTAYDFAFHRCSATLLTRPFAFRAALEAGNPTAGNIDHRHWNELFLF